MATSWPIKLHTAAKPGVKRKSNKDAQNKNDEKYEAYRKRLFLKQLGYRQILVTKWRRKRNDLQNLCWTLRTNTGISFKNLQGSSKKHLFPQVLKIIESVQYLTMRKLVYISMHKNRHWHNKQLTKLSWLLKGTLEKDLELKFRNVHALI